MRDVITRRVKRLGWTIVTTQPVGVQLLQKNYEEDADTRTVNVNYSSITHEQRASLKRLLLGNVELVSTDPLFFTIEVSDGRHDIPSYMPFAKLWNEYRKQILHGYWKPFFDNVIIQVLKK